MRTLPNNTQGLILFRHDGSIAIKPGTLGKPGYRGVDPQEPWRRLYEHADEIVRRWAGYEIDEPELRYELYGPGGLKADVWNVDMVQRLMDDPQLVNPSEAGEVLDALLDGRIALEGPANMMREALYQVLKARKQLEGSSRLKALQRLEGCKACKSIDFVVRSDGTRVCGCGREWTFDVEMRVRTVRARNSRAKNPKERAIEVQERTLVAKGRTLVTVEL